MDGIERTRTAKICRRSIGTAAENAAHFIRDINDAGIMDMDCLSKTWSVANLGDDGHKIWNDVPRHSNP